MRILPEKMLRCLSPSDRRAIGQFTFEEVLQHAEVKNERQLQSQIVQLLRLKSIEPLWHRTDKRSAATIGWPDITFCVGVPGWDRQVGCAWEIKFGDGQLSKEQQQMAVRLQSPPNCWRFRVIRSVDQALAELKDMGLQQRDRTL